MNTKTITFTDKERNLAVVTIGIKDCTITMSADCYNHRGQCLDLISPKNDAQARIIEIWQQHHLKKLNNIIFKDVVDAIEINCNKIEELEKERLITIDDIHLFEDFEEPEKVLAIALQFDLCLNNVEDILHDSNCEYTIQGLDYLVCTDSEADDLWEEHLDNFIDECLEIPKNLRRYFDDEKWKNDEKQNGRSSCLGRYNGKEIDFTVNDTTYYFYRQ